MQNHEFEWWGKDRQYRPCFGTIEKQLKTRDGLSDPELQKRVITLLNVLKDAKIPLHTGAMAYSVYKWQQSEYFHIKYFMKPEVYVNKYWPRYFSTIDPPNMEKLKENFSVDYYGDKLRILYGLIENGGVNKLGEHLIYAKTDPSLMATGPVVLFNKEPVTCNNLTNKDLFTFEQAICSQFAIGKDSGFSVWIYVAEETEEEAEVHASKIRIGAKIDETKFIEVTNPSLKEQFLEKYGYKKTKQYDFYGYKPTMKPFTRPKN